MSNDISALFSALPEALKAIHDEASEVGKTMVVSHLKAQNIMTRDEFNEHKKLLNELIAKLDKLESALQERTLNLNN